MPKIPFLFNDIARARLCECDGSGSDHSSDDSPDLSDMIDSFIELDGIDDQENDYHHKYIQNQETNTSETIKKLKRMLISSSDSVKRAIRQETERIIEMSSCFDKQSLMNGLRERGLNAGLCRSEWERCNTFPAGSYEYIDVIFDGKRYIVEVSLSGEFNIARPTDRYRSFLKLFPKVFVGREEELKQVVRLMCREMKESMKVNDMHVPPWRRNGYMESKWFGSYKRSTGRKNGDWKWQPEGFAAFCRDEFIGKNKVKAPNIVTMINRMYL